MTETFDTETLGDLEFFSEEVTTASEDAHEAKGFAPITPGKYYSPSRQLIVNRAQCAKHKYLWIDIRFEPFRTQDNSEDVTKLPPFENITSKMRKSFGTGMISSLHRYMDAFGMDSRQFKGKALYDALMSTADKPVIVRVKWEDDYRDRPQGVFAKKQDFFRDAEKGIWVHEKRDPESGRILKAMARVADYYAVAR